MISWSFCIWVKRDSATALFQILLDAKDRNSTCASLSTLKAMDWFTEKPKGSLAAGRVGSRYSDDTYNSQVCHPKTYRSKITFLLCSWVCAACVCVCVRNSVKAQPSSSFLVYLVSDGESRPEVPLPKYLLHSCVWHFGVPCCNPYTHTPHSVLQICFYSIATSANYFYGK